VTAETSAPPVLRSAIRLHVLVDPPVEVGEISLGFRRVIPITGGTWTAVGPDGGELSGEVVPGGADWNTEVEE